MNEIIISNIDPQNITIGEGGTTGITIVYVNGVDVTVGNVAYIVVPTKTSELQNDSGYITQEDDPTVPYYVKQIKLSDITNWNNKQNALVSGQNIKTINDQSLLGSGNINVDTSYTAGTGIQITDENVINNTITSYNDLSNLPTIPTKTSDLQNDSDFVTSDDLSIYATLDTNELLNYFTKDYFFKILPKLTGTGSSVNLSPTVDDTPLYLSLGATELSQDGTPTPNNPQDIHTISGSNTIKVEGKNLFDKSTILENSLISSTGAINTSTGSFVSDYIFLKGGTTYYNNTRGYSNAGFYDLNKTFIERADLNQNTTYTPANNCYVRLNGKLENIDTYQFEVGSTATTYEPYVSQEADIDLKSKNLFDKNTTIIGAYIDNSGVWTSSNSGEKSFIMKVEPSTTYTLSKLSTAKLRIIANLTKNFTFGTTYTKLLNLASSNTGGTFTTGANDNYIAVFFLNNSSETYTLQQVLDSMIINEGSIALPYVPYYDYGFMGSIGNYEDKFIRNSGKNLFDKSTAQIGKNWNGNTMAYSIASDYIEVNQDEKYNLSVSNMSSYSSHIFALLDSSKTYVSSESTNQITIPSGVKYIVVSLRSATTHTWTQSELDSANIMLNKGDTALDYEPYGSNEWYIKKNIGKVVFTGDEDITRNTNPTIYYKIIIPNKAYVNNNINIGNYCNRYVSVANNFSDLADGKFSISSSGDISLCDSTYNTLEQYKTYLANNETYVYYILATPTYTQITGDLAEQLEQVYKNMTSYDGQTNISQVNNDLPFTITAETLKDISNL